MALRRILVAVALLGGADGLFLSYRPVAWADFSSMRCDFERKTCREFGEVCVGNYTDLETPCSIGRCTSGTGSNGTKDYGYEVWSIEQGK